MKIGKYLRLWRCKGRVHMEIFDSSGIAIRENEKNINEKYEAFKKDLRCFRFKYRRLKI